MYISFNFSSPISLTPLCTIVSFSAFVPICHPSSLLQSAMGTYGYAGLVNLGQLPITVGSKTAKHTVMISEETNFDVVLGRSWMEKMGIK